ncbi:MAG: hypothetical protein ABI577_01240 [bacterium]
MTPAAPVRILIYGHSDTFGVALADGTQAWPNLVMQELPHLVGRPVEVTQRPFLPVRAGAGERAERILGEHPADIVVFASNPYGFAVATVANRLRGRLGETNTRRYTRLERKLNKWTRAIPMGDRINNTGRRMARKVLGTAPESSYQDVMQAHSEVLRVLARHESLEVVMMGGNKLSTWIQKEKPALMLQVESMREMVEEFCREHHFTWFNTETALLPGVRERSFLPDGVHRNAEAHRHFANLILPVLKACGERAMEGEPVLQQ